MIVYNLKVLSVYNIVLSNSDVVKYQMYLYNITGLNQMSSLFLCFLKKFFPVVFFLSTICADCRNKGQNKQQACSSVCLFAHPNNLPAPVSAAPHDGDEKP